MDQKCWGSAASEKRKKDSDCAFDGWKWKWKVIHQRLYFAIFDVLIWSKTENYTVQIGDFWGWKNNFAGENHVGQATFGVI